MNSNNLKAVKIYIFVFWVMKPSRLITSIYEELAASKFAASPARLPNIEIVTILFLIKNKGKLMAKIHVTKK